jgi:hypothetical protein
MRASKFWNPHVRMGQRRGVPVIQGDGSFALTSEHHRGKAEHGEAVENAD